MLKTQEQVLAEREDIERAIAGKTLGDVLLRNAQEVPDKPTMTWKEGDRWQTLTWKQYRDRVAAFAMGLAQLGVEHGDVVAIMACNRWEHVVADQGAVHAAATPTTFYSTLAPDQIRYVAENSTTKVAVLENRDYMKRWNEIRSELPALEHIVLMEHAEEFADFDRVLSFADVLERGEAALKADPDAFERRWRSVTPDDNACLIYTSGTTGPPKGVMITHHNVMYEGESLSRALDLPEDSVGVSYLPLAHIAEREASIYLGMWMAGHGYLCPDPKQVLEYVQQAHPKAFSGVPRVWEKFRAGILAQVAAIPDERRRKLAERALATALKVARARQEGRTPSLATRLEHAVLDRVVLSKIRAGIGLDRVELCSSSAAPLPPDVGEFFVALGLPFNEVWGMTETTGAATTSRPEEWRLGKVGFPLPGIELKIADSDGEVLVRGPICVPGYLNLPDATADLIDDDGWLHTGDVGELDDDGYLKLVDRKKELIITAGGKNLSPANIEALLKEHPLVGQALAYGDGKPYVTALLVLDGEVAPGWAAQRGIEQTDLAALAQDPTVRVELETAVEKANGHLARVEQVKKFAVLPVEWTPDSEELTPTLKLRRRVVHERYRNEIESLYVAS